MKTRAEILDGFRACIKAYRKAKEECINLTDAEDESIDVRVKRIVLAELRGEINAFEFVLGMKVKDVD